MKASVPVEVCVLSRAVNCLAGRCWTRILLQPASQSAAIKRNNSNAGYRMSILGCLESPCSSHEGGRR